MTDIDLPRGKRTPLYRLFEIIPALLSYGVVLLLIVLSLFNPFAAAIYLLLIIVTTLIKSAGVAYRTLSGHRLLVRAQSVDWHARLLDLENPEFARSQSTSDVFTGIGGRTHQANLDMIAKNQTAFPRPSEIYHIVIIATYNESYDVLKPTLESLDKTTYRKDRMIVVIAYEERGGKDTRLTAEKLKKEYDGVFFAFKTIMHPKDLPDELIGKGPNITYAAQRMQAWCHDKGIQFDRTIVTTLDSDNRPFATYFDYVSYEYIVHPNRKKLSYQPIALYFGNIWDAPAPMRVIATGNSFWTIISSMRPHTLRNFAAHSQPFDALIEMNFWSKHSIVEDGHQYWRSYFHFDGDYSVIPIHVPIYQDAVMSDTLKATLIAQFKQLRRWGYGVSDIPYVAVRLFSRTRTVPFMEGLARFLRLIDSHVTLASMAILITFGGWIPLLINPDASMNYSAHLLPEVVSVIQRIAMVGIFITILLTMKMLPPRPARYKRRRTIGMVLQWLLMPITSVCYSSLASYNAQTHLALGKYLETFDVTDKATVESRTRVKQK